jgi:hypothetical protein
MIHGLHNQGGRCANLSSVLPLVCRCKDVYAELADVITHKWGIPLVLETELEALRTTKEQGGHYLGCNLPWRPS